MMSISSILVGSALPMALLLAGAQDDAVEAGSESDATSVEAAEAAAETGETPVVEEVPEAKKMRCKMTKVVNSRIPTRICATNETWELKEREMREQKQGTLNRNSQCSTSVRC